MLLEEAAEREQGQLVRHNPCQSMLLAPKKGVQNTGKACHSENPYHRAVWTCLCDRSLVILPNAMLFAGSDILRGPRTTFSLARHFFWLTSHSWPVWLQCSPWGRAANLAQHVLAISTLSPAPPGAARSGWHVELRGQSHCVLHLPAQPTCSPIHQLPVLTASCATSLQDLLVAHGILSLLRSHAVFLCTHFITLSAVSVPLLLMSRAF